MKAKMWIVVEKWIRNWTVVIRTRNGRDLMISFARSPRRIDAVRIAEKLAKVTGLKIKIRK